ncbi:MAG TPA: hypothetical protein ENK02_15820 [Planctomycetes bacterium]|nr:hypothetical protein [Planctomycetota bacterium]
MKDSSPESRNPESAPEGGKPPVEISIGELRKKLKAQPLPEKLFFFSNLVYLCATILPWESIPLSGPPEPSLSLNGWTFGGLTALGHLGILAALLIQLGGLAGLGPGLSRAFFRVYRWVLPCVALLVLFRLLSAARIGLGLWIAILALAIQLKVAYSFCERMGLLPFRLKP